MVNAMSFSLVWPHDVLTLKSNRWQYVFEYLRSEKCTRQDLVNAPDMTPEVARLLRRSYYLRVICKLTVRFSADENDDAAIPYPTLLPVDEFSWDTPGHSVEFPLADVPLIVHQDEVGIGGYFIYNGTEKFVVGYCHDVKTEVLIMKVKKNVLARILYSYVTGSRLFEGSFYACMCSISKALDPAKSRVQRNGFVQYSGNSASEIPCWVIRRRAQQGTLLSSNSSYVPFVFLLYGLGMKQPEISSLVCGREVRQLELFIEPSFRYAAEALAQLRHTERSDQDLGEERILSLLRKDLQLPQETSKQRIFSRLLPHIKSHVMKAHALCDVWRQLLLCMLGWTSLTDRDSIANRRPLSVGSFLRRIFRKHIATVQKQLRAKRSLQQYINTEIRDPDDGMVVSFDTDMFFDKVHAAVDPTKMLKMFVSGIIGHSRVIGGGMSAANVVRSLMRKNMFDAVAGLTTVLLPVQRTSNTYTKPRLLHSTSFGYTCCVATPEGQSCGVRTEYSIHGTLSLRVPSRPMNWIMMYVDSVYVARPVIEQEFDVKCVSASRDWKVYYNGALHGYTNKPFDLWYCLRAAKLLCNALQYLSPSFNRDDRSVSIWSDNRRHIRPLRVVFSPRLRGHMLELTGAVSSSTLHHMDTLLDYDDSSITELLDHESGMVPYCMEVSVEDNIRTGAVEWVDPYQAENCLIAVNMDRYLQNRRTQAFTHVEIGNGSRMLGLTASMQPFANHSPTPRVIYQGGMIKQAMGPKRFIKRFDRMRRVLYYPERPYVTTDVRERLKLPSLNAGCNCIMAIMPMEGYDQDDSVIFNKSSLERGQFRNLDLLTVEVVVDLSLETIGMPERCARDRGHDYIAVAASSDGIISPGDPWMWGTVLVAKTVKPVGKLPRAIPRDTSVAVRLDSAGFVNKVCRCSYSNPKNRPCCRVCIELRTTRQPQVGDKFTSGHGQKGVIGLVRSQEDMPFEVGTGLVPDIIVNPHMLPSRMTVGQLLEMHVANLGLAFGARIDGTPFGPQANVDIRVKGIGRYSRRRLCDPRTGKMLPRLIFMGPVYMYRLCRLVADVAHSRSHGPVEIITKQPVKGRARNGGLRIGTMEKDCLIAHGAALLLNERLLHVSDRCDCNFFVFVWVHFNNCSYCMTVCAHCKVPNTVTEYVRRNARQQHRPMKCTLCNREISTEDGTAITIRCPYAFRLLTAELQTMNVNLQLTVN